MRVFLDTNVLVSAVATRGLCSDIFLLVLSDHELVLGESVLAELDRVLRNKLRVPLETARELHEFLRREASVCTARAPHDLPLPDPADADVLAEAIAAKADVFVTGDRDFLETASRAPLPILSPRAFWNRIRESRTAED